MADILLIDDDPAFAEELKFLLEENGFEVTTVADGLDAFELLRKKKFDLVITDMIMLKSHGNEVILHVRKYYPAIKIITVSGGGWASPQVHLEAARVMGADACLVKPFSISELLQEIGTLLRP
jgi:DNA-binding response OmpR family regulator